MKNILVDSSVLQHAAIGDSKWHSTGKALWGGMHEVDTGCLETDVIIPKVPPNKGGPQAKAIGRLAQLFRDGSYRAFNSDALSFERSKHLSNKYSGKGYAGGTLLEGVEFTKISTLEGFDVSLTSHSLSDGLRSYLAANQQPLFKQIWDALKGKKETDKSSQDAWHLFTAIHWNLDFFVTADSALLGQIKSIQDKELRNRLTVVAFSPAELCEALAVNPLTDEELVAETDRFRIS